MTTTIFKILTGDQWEALQANGKSAGAPIDVADGYVHFSTAEQLRETAAKHFHAQDDLVLLAYESDRLGSELKWEPSRGGDLFPHLYAPLSMEGMLWSKPLPWKNDHHDFPSL